MNNLTMTEEERKLDYSDLLLKPLPEVAPKLLEEMEQSPVDPEKMTSIHDRNDILEPGYLEVENGYTRMPDGSGAVATKVEMPGVTPEMVVWWFAWHGIRDLRYRIWCPTEHYGIHVLEKDLLHRLDTSLSMAERGWGTTDVVTENVGSGPQEMHLTFYSPKDYGYDPDLVKNVDALINACVTDPKTGMRLITFSHCIRKIPGGIEYRSHYWQGYSIDENGKAYAASIPPEGFPMEVMKKNAYHSLLEYTNLAEILPELYEKYGKETDLQADHYKAEADDRILNKPV